jgi:signal transduction histidine kinase/CheY-like chemotaxis protein
MLESVLNGMEALVAVTTPGDCKVLFLNDAIRECFGIQGSGVGEYCYKVLQNRDAPCEGCPYQQLLDAPDKTIVWDHREFVKGRVLHKTARLIDWPGWQKAHLEYAIDITDLIYAEESLERRGGMLDALNRASAIFLSQSNETFTQAMSEGFALIAGIANVDRMSVSRNTVKADGLYATQIYRWSKEAGSEITPLEELQDNPYARNIPRWEEVLASGECINGPVSQMPEAKTLSRYGCRSVLAIPVFDKGVFWGFVVFEDFNQDRIFTADETDILRSASFMLMNAVIGHEMEEDLRSSSTRLQHALLEAEAANSAKSEFLSSMSHEMRTPLNAVIGMTAIGKRTNEKERKNYALDRIEEASTHLLGVINDILDMSKIEAGKLELSPVEFNLERMLQKVITVITNRVNEKQQKFSVQVSREVPRFVIGDDQRLAQIITNLLANATKFTPEGGKISLLISLLREKDGVHEIKVAVTDTGIGITAGQQARLFQSFVQAEGGISREFGGTGLGLSISKRLVEMMDGRIWVESEPGKGASFYFTVKLTGGTKDLRSLLDAGVKWDTVRVLVADGSEAVRQSFRDSFDRLGVRCETVPDGLSASRAGEEHGPFDICFIDWHIPGMDGAELARSIKAGKGGGVVILISSMDWERLQEAVRDSGADRGLSKPLLASALVDCMNECLGNPYENRKNINANEFAGKSLLLTEDNEINQEIVISLLEDTGLHIDCARNGKEAVDFMGANPGKYDVIFMDMQMPVMDGLEATRRIRLLPAAWCRQIPIVAMTANVFQSDIERCVSAGMNDHIGKPIDFDDMADKLRKYLFDKQYARGLGHPDEYAGHLLGSWAEDLTESIVRLLKPGTAVSVESWGLDRHGNENTTCLPAAVEEVCQNGLFLLRMPLCPSTGHSMTRGEILSVYFTAESPENRKNEAFVITSRLAGKIRRGEAIYITLEAVRRPERSQRRGSHRLPLSIGVTLRRVSGTEISSFAARMVNFSDSGMLISTNENLDIGETITLEFSIERHETVNGTVLRTVRTKDESPQFEAAISFERASREQKERFLRFIREQSQDE